jgi:hypothetical protein
MPPPPEIRDSLGPTNINYWHWAKSQVLIIDDIGPLTATPKGHADIDRFKALLDGPLREIAGVLAHRHTVWVLGDLGPAGPTLIDEFAKAVAGFCRAAQPLTILLSRVPEEAPPVIEGRSRRLMRWLWPPSPPASGRRAAAGR